MSLLPPDYAPDMQPKGCFFIAEKHNGNYVVHFLAKQNQTFCSEGGCGDVSDKSGKETEYDGYYFAAVCQPGAGKHEHERCCSCPVN